ncbi:MAG: flagellar basal body rod protein FlgB [Verrucomicrobia bacterium]|nr:flagellar basal body rod protein FlgB [Verrucomicrobiota bacterium]MBI3870335.1 flagellar basal body rod protein FlgB [Verrucomicrobiota bacterium]
MIDALFQQPDYLAAKRMMSGTAMERVAIAANVANVETPDYHRIQVSPAFSAQLQEALKSNDLASLQSLAPQFEEDTSNLAGRLDGNNVVLEKELVSLMKNSVDHSLETQLVTGNLLQLRLAITGRG